MSDSRTTELREKLTERGVKWWPMRDDNGEYSEDRDTEFVIDGKKYTYHEWGEWSSVYGVTPEQAIAATLGRGACEFTIEYDRDEVERRRKMYEENPLGLFPQDMPESAWTCSNCGQQFKCHYDRQTGKLLPVPDWMKCCPSCGKRIRKAVER